MADMLQRAELQRAEFALAIGDRAGVRARVEVTPAGLVAIGALVSSVLLSTAVLVRASVRDGKRLPG